ncbi:MAG: YggT family protein [Alkalispirochaetaceae bacterium]
MLQPVMRVVSSAISIYMIVLFIRILMTWFQGVSHGRTMELLRRVTDPYLNWFRRFEIFRFGNFDFSPVVAILSLSVLNTIAIQLANAGPITLGFILALILSAVWSAFSFFVLFFLILTVIRLVGLLLRRDAGHFWFVLDQILDGIVNRVARPFMRGRFLSHRDGLLIFAGVDLAILLIGNPVVDLITGLFLRLPI